MSPDELATDVAQAQALLRDLPSKLAELRAGLLSPTVASLQPSAGFIGEVEAAAEELRKLAATLRQV
jgi:hypothetical protein